MGRRLTFDIDEALDAAMTVFWEKGYDGSTLDDLTKAMGIGRPSLYHVYGNKEKLFGRVLRKYEREKLGFAWRALRLPTTRQVIRNFVHGFLCLATSSFAPKGCLGTHAAIACSDESAPIKILIEHRRDIYIDALARRFRRALADGDMPGGLDPRVLAVYVITIVNGLAIQAKYGLDHALLTKAAEMAIASFDHMLDHEEQSPKAT